MVVFTSIALLLSLVGQQFTNEDRFGKSVDQMLAMGRTKWHEWYTDGSRGGLSTAGETFAEMTFADGLKQRNAAWRATATAPVQRLVDRLDKDFASTLANCVDVGRAFTGGGTMWNPISAGCAADVEEAIADVLHPSSKMPGSSQDEFWRTWKRASQLIEKNKQDIDDMADMGGANSKQAVHMLANVASTFHALLPELANASTPIKRRVFAEFRDLVSVILNSAE
ncbi:MAG: hypothetical protein JSS66_16275 [Armatimonadetes bacterium]|nr:hypothetical protein [Armatimonadota bacterium]